MPAIVHLIRHGEVDNPDGVVYADLPGFGLGQPGLLQAETAAARLALRPVVALVTSPLQRAAETAAVIGADLGLTPEIDERLTEWRLATHWAGVRWSDLPAVFPGELAAYLDHPHLLPFSPESLEEVAERMAGLLSELARRHPGGEVVAVSHQDPIQAVRLHLTGRSLAGLHTDKPGHAAGVTLEEGMPWRETEVWAPDAPASEFPPISGNPSA